ncbi:MAG TPA: cytochrome b/b6 domain-containing protein [Armatimonadota bacterium]|nr:cytochrome b/b6 domain-containing protein [Armatimonadota bacterium]
MKSVNPEERTFERFTLNQRIQHITLIASFTTLVITGLPLRYADTVWAGWLFTLLGGPTGRALIHRIAAVMMMGLAVYHVGYLILAPRGRRDFLLLLPRPQDALDMIQHMLYYLGIRKDPPRFGRFSYLEKFEYLALFWGTGVMIATGLVLWFHTRALFLFPLWVVDICRIAHSYEALLAFLSILVWHMYCVHLNADVFPMSRVWLTGRMTETEMRHHHPREYEEIMRREQEEKREQVQLETTVTAGKGSAR